jgi:hypothetical protein
MAKEIYQELGATGLEHWGGYVQEAYNAKLYWPSVQPLYSRLRRSDPEVVMARNIFQALASEVELKWDLQTDEPTSDDLKAQEFGTQVLEELDGGVEGFISDLINNVPFYGWGWWEILWGVRNPKWKAPDTDDDWRSSYDDGLIVPRRLAFRDSSSFMRWDMNDAGKVLGMVQQTDLGKQITLPVDKSLHITYGDSNNPEGLSPLEAVWRLERLMYGLEVVQGIGFEHAAGHLMVKVDGELTDKDKAAVRNLARALMSAQEGNYAVLPQKVTEAEIKDVTFQAAGSILEAIKYYGIRKLTVFAMQWAALSSMTDSGSYAAMQDSSTMFMMTYNNMIKGFVRQLDDQLGRRLFDINAGAFPNMTKRPRLVATEVEKIVNLDTLATFADAMSILYQLNDADQNAFRRKSGFLPDEYQQDEEGEAPEPAPVEDREVDEAVEQFSLFAKDNYPELYKRLQEDL